ncbi:glycosyltransferase family 4 protein [Olleya aquimaris]|uniref:Glycosyltransferase involved in cell wall biosynthesis n=1 Tax=Olleya aquimaris TaxID=639310 RepID=A0A327RIT0_9FLAO|nr:glycosyltransferase family 4 protein [Olleya aquimaris]RAJ16986.1 glycosyltransferase involved in cell wall biosynthesis [Olleya aquimaris]
MKLLMVAIPNHHFFQWVNQLKDSGYEVYWFDVTDGGPQSPKIEWVTQIKGWKLKWNFPFRSTIKKRLPKLYKCIQKYNEHDVSKAFQNALTTIQPDIVHCFEMQLAGLPILPIMEQNTIPLIYSSWGSDVFYFKELGVSKQELERFYKRTNYLVTDCQRDYHLAVKNGFNNRFLGVFPGNGGLTINNSNIKPVSERPIILIKGYDDGVGKASIVLKALELVSVKLLDYKQIVIYSADDSIQKQIQHSKILSSLPFTIHSRYTFIQNKELLELMGKSCLHIANSISDGMPNALLEAMSMGAFPIQSNPGQVTEEVLVHGKNGLLIANPLDVKEIAKHIETALKDDSLRQQAQDFNVNFMQRQYNRTTLQPKIQTLYQTVYSEYQ